MLKTTNHGKNVALNPQFTLKNEDLFGWTKSLCGILGTGEKLTPSEQIGIDVIDRCTKISVIGRVI
jgi:hypothetical protein